MHDCENCAKGETCKKTIGIIFGGCVADFKPKSNIEQEEQTA